LTAFGKMSISDQEAFAKFGEMLVAKKQTKKGK